MQPKFVYIFLIGLLLSTTLYSQELNATISIQSSKVENQVDPKLFTQLQTQLKDFINQRKWSSDVFAAEEKIDCSFFITIESVLSPGVFDTKLSVVSNRPVYNAAYASSLLNMQDANFVFKYQLAQPIEFNENRVQGSDPLAANLTATIAYYIYVILGLDYDSFASKGGLPYFEKALNIVNNAPEGAGISGWKSYDGQRNRYILIDNFTKTGADKIHDVIYSYYRNGLDAMSEKPELAKGALLNALMSFQEIHEASSNSMAVPILMQGKYAEIVGVFNTADKSMKKQLITTLSSIDISNINKYKEKLE
ncbi:MAG: DUF4835 family protein [Chitinophagia bacterium]|jgi:hypothetical protein